MHFDCAVVMDGTKTLEELLAPFDERTKDKAFLAYDPKDENWYNPNAKWDEWILCERGLPARFQRDFAPDGFVKPGDFARLTAAERRKWSRYWMVHVVEGKPDEEHPFLKPGEMLEWYETRENFVHKKCHKICHAFLKNGVFHRSPIWRRPENAKAWKRYEREWKAMIERNKNKEGVVLAIVDCHI